MPRRRRRLLAFSAVLAFVAAVGAAPLVVSPAFADGVLEIATPAEGSTHTWESGPGFHVTGTTTDIPTAVEIYTGATLLGSCMPDVVGDFDCGVNFPYPGPHTISAEQGGVPHDSINVTVLYPEMNTPLNGFTVDAVSGGPATFSGQAQLFSAGYEFGFVSVDFGGGDTRTCQDAVGAFFGDWVCDVNLAGVPDGTYPVEVWTTGGPASGVHTWGTLTIAPYAVPVPTITSPAPVSYMTTNGAVVVGGNYNFGALTGGMGGFVTVTIGGIDYCATDFYSSAETSWTCEIYPQLGMNSVTAVVTEGDMAGQMSLPSAVYVVGLGTSGDPTLDTPADGAIIAPAATVNFSGTGPVISQPIVEIREYPAGVGFAPWCYGNVIGPAGTWSCPPSTTLNEGEWEVRVSTEDVNGVITTSTPIRVTQLAGSVGGLAIVAPFNGDFPQYGPTFSMNGSAPTGDPLTVVLDGAPHACSGTLPIDNGLGGWDWYCSTSAPGAVPLPGPHTLQVIQDPGVVEDAVAITVISGPPSLDGLPLGAGYGDTTFDVSGQANYFPSMTSEVHLELVGYPGAGCVSLPVDSFGNFSCVMNLTGVPIGDNHSLNVWQEDDGTIGVVGANFLDILAATPTLTVPAVGGYDTLASNVIVGGNYDFGSLPGGSGGQIIVTVTDPNGIDTDYCDTFITGGYNPAATAWTCDIPLAVGVNDVSMRIQDPVTLAYTLQSNEVAVRRGTAAPTTLSSPANGSTVPTPLTFAGTGPALGNLAVQYRHAGTLDPFTTECTTQVEDDGTWTCLEAIPVGDWDVQVTATDLMGGVTTTPITSFTAGYAKPAMTYTRVGANGISAQANSAAGWLTIRLYSVDYTSDPTQYSWGAPIPGPCPANIQLTVTCSFGSPELSPGIWNVFTVDEHDNPPTAIGSLQDDYFYVPTAPSITPTLNANATVTISVTREAGTLVTVRDLATSAVACTISGAGTGGSCTISPTEGTHEYTAQAQSVGFVADTGTPGQLGDDSFDWYSTVATSIPIAVPAAPPAPPAPAPSPSPTPTPTTRAPWTWSFTVSGGEDGYHPGDKLTFRGSGVPAGSTVSIELHSTPTVLGTTVAGDGGTFIFEGVIPADVEPGAHHFVLTATPPGEAPSVLEESVEIQLPSIAVDEDPEAEVDPTLAAAGSEGGGGSGGGSGARSEPAAPSILSGSLATLGHIVEDPFVLVLAGGLTIALLFLVAVPTELLNSTLSANTGRLGRVFVAVDDRLERLKSWFIRVTRSRALASGILVLVLSLIYGFTDPDFGFDLVSLRLVLSLAIGMFILTYLIGWVTGLLSRATWGVYSQVDLRPSIAIFAVVGVVAARILEFSPGFFVGVVIGLELLQASQRVASRVALLQFSLVVGVSVGAWLWYSALITGGPPTDFGGALLGDTLVALTAEGLTAAVIAILPLRFLEGRELYKESKALWLGAFLVIAFAFALLVLPTAMRGTEVGDVGVWVIVFAIFAVVTFALWATFATIERRREAVEERNTAQHDRVHG